MDRRLKAAIVFNVVILVVLLAWPLLTAPKIRITLNEETVPLGGQLTISAELPARPRGLKLEIVDLKLNRTVEVRDLNPSMKVSETVVIEEGKYSVGRHAVRLIAEMPWGTVEEEAFFSIFGGDKLSLIVEVHQPVIRVSRDQLVNGTVNVSTEILVRVEMRGVPQEGVKILASPLQGNSTVTEVAYTGADGSARLSWSASASTNTTFQVAIHAIKPGHPIASKVAEIRVEVGD